MPIGEQLVEPAKTLGYGAQRATALVSTSSPHQQQPAFDVLDAQRNTGREAEDVGGVSRGMPNGEVVVLASRPMSRLRSLIACVAVALVTAPAGALAQPLDGGGRTPVARPGSPEASTRALSASELRHDLARALSGAGGNSGAWVFDTEGGSNAPLFASNASAKRVPASNQKLFTTAAFLDELGAGGHLETRAYAAGKLGGPGRSVLDGDLVLVGDGDPALGTARFARAEHQPVTRIATLAANIARAGVKRITGRILADDTIFDRIRREGPYLSPLSGLSFNNGYDGGSYASDPELVAAKALKNALRKRGVKVGGRVGRKNLTNAELSEDALASVASPPAKVLIEETNAPSNNFFAEMLLKRVGAASGKRGTRRRGAAAVEAFAKSVGSEVQAVDGSGLSRRNNVSPAEVGDLLVGMTEDGTGAAAFRDSLPVAGREGTVADRMRGTAAEGNCAAKTGTLDGVSALSGYCEAGGHTIAFSILNNGVDVNAARSAQDRMAAAIARYRP